MTVFHMAADMNPLNAGLVTRTHPTDQSDYLARKNKQGLTPLDLAATEHVGCVMLLFLTKITETRGGTRHTSNQVKANPKPQSMSMILKPLPKRVWRPTKARGIRRGRCVKAARGNKMQTAAEISASAADVTDEQKPRLKKSRHKVRTLVLMRWNRP
jgi:hypothetical protein